MIASPGKRPIVRQDRSLFRRGSRWVRLRRKGGRKTRRVYVAWAGDCGGQGSRWI